MERMVFTVGEAASALGLSRNLVYELVRQGQIPSVRMGAKRILIPRVALERSIEESAMRNAGAA